MKSYREMIQTFDTIAYHHLQINSFHSGYMDEVDINKLDLKDYAILYVEPSTATLDTGTLVYTFNVYVLDRVNDETHSDFADNSEQDERRLNMGRMDIFSENLRILKDVINEFKHSMYLSDPATNKSGTYTPSESILETPINIEPFTARFNNLLTGWSAQLNIQVNNTNDLCISPITEP